MGRKPIPPNQRAQPISFSLKPHLIEKIDDYCSDHRFNRSKFLMEAVTRFMLATDMEYIKDEQQRRAMSSDVADMTLDRRVVVGLSALQQANREGETISKPIMDALRRELEVSDIKQVVASLGGESIFTNEESLEAVGLRRLVSPNARITTKKYIAGEYYVKADNTVLGKVVKQGKRWRAVGINSPAFQIMNGRTLKEVTQIISAAVREEEVYY